MSEQKKVGLDIARASTLVQAYEVMSRERNPLPEDDALKEADARLAADPENADLHMERGLVLAGLGYYREAAEEYSRAIAINPFKWEYYRHRAHRFVSCGLFADAAADFTLASRLNPKDWNVWYHLGLSWFLLGRYEKAEEAYARCAALSKTDDDVVAVTDWRYTTLMRLGREAEAKALLEPITPDMHMGDEASSAYHKRLLLYKGLLKPEELFNVADDAEGAGLEIVTQGFGLANYYLYHGDREKYRALLQKVMDVAARSRWYSAFAALASHVDMSHMAD